MRIRVWLIYDLGFDGDYTRFYEWLDSKDAKECVMGGATFMSTFHVAVDGDNERVRDQAFHELEQMIPVNMEENPSTRIYAVMQVKGETYGRFLFGNRRIAPWYGSSHHETDKEDG